MVIALGSKGSLVDVLQKEGVQWKCLGGKRLQPLRIILHLALTLRDFQPEIIQSFMFHANLATRLAAPWAGSPWVVSGLRVAERQKKWHLVLDRLTARLTTGWVCVSRGVRDFSRDVAKLRSEQLEVIPNGIDVTPSIQQAGIPQIELGVPPRAHIAIFIGRLDIQKGIPDLLAAAELVLPHCPNWHLLIAGDGPLRGWLLQQMTSRPALASNIHWLGMRNDIPALLQTADVLVLPSLWEGMPNVVLEAMAANRPVIATSVEGTNELVVPGETGWLVPPNNPGSLARALLSAARDPESCQVFGRQGYVRAATHFSIEQAVMAYDRLWSRILGYQVPLDKTPPSDSMIA